MRITLPKNNGNPEDYWVEILTDIESGWMHSVSGLNFRWAQSTNKPTENSRAGYLVDPNDPPYFTSGGHNKIWACSDGDAIVLSVNKSTDAVFESGIIDPNSLLPYLITTTLNGVEQDLDISTNNLANVERFQVEIGTSIGANDIESAFSLTLDATETSKAVYVRNLPANGGIVYIRIRAKIGAWGDWRSYTLESNS